MNYWKKLKKLIFKEKEPEFLYTVIGMETGVYELVKNFYEIMETDAKAKECLDVHEIVGGVISDEVKKKLFMFLCGWFGGPNLYIERFGHPRMRARHQHIKISKLEANQWLYCMFKALDIHSIKIKKTIATVSKAHLKP